MSVGTWGPGTGATGTGSHPFCLRVQGVCYIASVPMESIAVTQSASGNGTLTFTIVDPTSSLPVPEGWADVEFADRTEQEVIFGGLVMGTTVSLDAAGMRTIAVRCVDYSRLLDVTPLPVSGYGPNTGTIPAAIQQIAGQFPLGGIAALEWAAGGPGCVVGTQSAVSYAAFPTAELSLTRPGSARPRLEHMADVVEVYPVTYPASARPAEVWVTPLRQLAFAPAGTTIGTAPLEVRQNPTTAAHIAAEDVESDSGYEAIEGGVFVGDSDPTGTDYSAFVGGTLNGYTVMPGQLSLDLAAPPQEHWRVQTYLDRRSSVRPSYSATVTTVKNFMVGQALTVYYPNVGLDGSYAIHAVSTRFLGGLYRRTEIQFGGELGTVAKFNRTRFARAGVTT